MSTDRDLDRIVRSWMDEGVTQLPDRVLDLVLEQIPATPQRHASWLARRFSTMNNYARIGLVAAVVLAAVVGIGLYGRSGVGVPPPEASASVAPSVEPSPTASPITGPIVGTWATGETTCQQQVAAIDAAGYTAEQMTSIGMDPTCANGLVTPGSGFTLGSQFTLTFDTDGNLRQFDGGVSAFDGVFRPVDSSTFELTGPPTVCLTYRYVIDGDQLRIQMLDPGCPFPGEAPLVDQLAQTVIFETSPFTKQP